ncbi:MAG TPA: NAD(P)-dependent oxidoreductase [Nitrospiria bacterium]|nr:NAD(P)-dependent oxidoreductase [Nitrospiria bacterium]
MSGGGSGDNPRVLLTGATGFIGSHVLDRVLMQEGRVRVLALPETIKDLRQPDRVEVVAGSVTDEALLTEAVRGVEMVYHMAALLPGSSHVDLMKINVHGTENLLRACGRAGGIRRFVFTSSVAVYGGAFSPNEWPINEDTPTNPRGTEDLRNYGRSKVAAESLVRRYAKDLGFEPVILRPSTCYGVGSPSAEAMVQRALTDPRAGSGPGSQVTMQLIHVRDLAEGIVRAGTLPEAAHEAFNLAGIEVATYRDVVSLIRRLGGRTEWVSPWPDPSQVWRRYVLIYEMTKAERLLGFVPGTAMQEGFAEMAAAFDTHGSTVTAADQPMMPLY